MKVWTLGRGDWSIAHVEVFVLCSGWLSLPAGGDRGRCALYLRYGLSYRDVGERLAERGITVDHVMVYRWVQTFTSEFINAARFARHTTGDRWFLDETYVEVACPVFVQNLRRGHYEITVDVPVHDRVRATFTDLAVCL